MNVRRFKDVLDFCVKRNKQPYLMIELLIIFFAQCNNVEIVIDRRT